MSKKLDLTKKKVVKKTTKEAPKKIFTLKELEEWVPDYLYKFLNGPSKHKWIITGKGYGKNRAIALLQIAWQQTNYRAQGLQMRKHKTNAGEILHVEMQNHQTMLKRAGYHIPDYEFSTNKSYVMKSKEKSKNKQAVQYKSFDDYNECAGIKGMNNGWYPFAYLDEPILLEKPGTKKPYPSPEEWDTNYDAIVDSVDRATDEYNAMFPDRWQEPTKFILGMNLHQPEHPLAVRAEKYLPQEEFLEYILKDIINNHTMTRYIEEIDTDIMRGTKFGMPINNLIENFLRNNKIKHYRDWLEKKEALDFTKYKKYPNFVLMVESHLTKNKLIPLYVQAERAIEQGNHKDLVQILGIAGDISGIKYTYNLSNLQTCDTDELLKTMKPGSNLVLAWDIDSKRAGRFVCTPVFASFKMDVENARVVKNIIVGKQKEIPCAGINSNGSNLDLYASKLIDTNKELRNKYKFNGRLGGKPVIYVDDNQKWWTKTMDQAINGQGEARREEIICKSVKFKNKKGWTIIQRQDWLQQAIDSGYLIIDESNTKLIRDLKKSRIKHNSKQRDEDGAASLDMDRINSMEYALYPFRRALLRDMPPGKPEDYIQKENTNELNSMK